MKQITFFLIVSLLGAPTFSQSSQKGRVNEFDSTGKKHGYWVEVEDGYKAERNYLHGIKSGMEKLYYRNGTLSGLFEYANGHTIHTGYFFLEDGRLGFSVHYLGFVIYKNKKLQKGEFTTYYPDGSIEEKGIGLFNEGEEELGEEIKIGK